MGKLSYHRYRCLSIVIQQAIWLHFRCALSYRDVEDMLAGRGIDGAVTLTLGVGPAMNRRCAISHITATAFQPRSSSMPSGCISDFL